MKRRTRTVAEKLGLKAKSKTKAEFGDEEEIKDRKSHLDYS
jgi:hypothetical protein